MLELFDEIESRWQSRVVELSDAELEAALQRWNHFGQCLRKERHCRHQQKRVTLGSQPLMVPRVHKDGSTNNESRQNADAKIPPEVLRQVLPFLSAEEVGRCLVLCSKSILWQVGSETVWRDICEKMYQPTCCYKTGDVYDQNSPITNVKVHQPVLRALGSYKMYFHHRYQTSISLHSRQELLPLSNPTTSPTEFCLMLDIWKGTRRLVSRIVPDLEQLCNTGNTTVELEEPIEVAVLPKSTGNGWNIPNFFHANDGHARIQLFRLHNGPLRNNHDGHDYSIDQENQSTRIRTIAASPVLLETDFTWWRGWARHGEMTFLQHKRTAGLRLTDRGQWIQHRIVECRHPQWIGYFGLQFKLILICERLETIRLPSDNNNADNTTSGRPLGTQSHPQNQQHQHQSSQVEEFLLPNNNHQESRGASFSTTGINNIPETNGEFVRYGFTKIRVEGIRLHENTHGNIQHHLFRKDQGWEKHGVTLLHLFEEIC